MGAPVIAAIDLGPLTAPVLRHAAALAALLQAPLKVLHVSGDRTDALRERVLEACLQAAPYEFDFDESQIVLRPGHVSDTIARQAHADRAILIVMGSRAHGAIATALLGSTSEAVLRHTTTPVLLVPPNHVDIVSIGDRPTLTCGPVVAAVDLSESSREQLQVAARLARIASRPLLLMTVAKSRVTDHDAVEQLRQRADELSTPKPHALIVRRGIVGEEISRCAVTEGSGLVVMGLRDRARGRPGSIASAVLRTRRAFVLAVPNAQAVPVEAGHPGRLLPITAVLLMALSAPVTTQGPQFADVAAIAAFQRAADSYAFVHRQAERRIGQAHRRAGEDTAVAATELRRAIIDERSRTSLGPLFTPRAVDGFRQIAARVVREGCDPGELSTGVWELTHDVNTPADGTRPLAACMAAALPRLPEELEYRSAGTVLLLVDVHANLVVDILPALLAGSNLRR